MPLLGRRPTRPRICLAPLATFVSSLDGCDRASRPRVRAIACLVGDRHAVVHPQPVQELGIRNEAVTRSFRATKAKPRVGGGDHASEAISRRASAQQDEGGGHGEDDEGSTQGANVTADRAGQYGDALSCRERRVGQSCTRIWSLRQDVYMSRLTDEDAEDVRLWLSRNAFKDVSSVGGDTTDFGDRQDTWERDGTLVRLTRDRGQWWYDMSRTGTGSWLDVDTVSGAMGYKLTAPVERVAYIASSIDDRVFGALLTVERHSP